MINTFVWRADMEIFLFSAAGPFGGKAIQPQDGG
ncbi:hypothetical protein SY94_2044 [Agrobacterium tumefaciens]|jgi:hypothetical protein|nr:hypothetical protein SY94_2044 [Agrobacterium tumefaciens]